MGQKRMIHLSIWSNEDFCEMGNDIKTKLRRRLLYIGLITLADDDGRIKYNPKYIKSNIFAWDEEIKFEEVDNDIKFMAKRGDFIFYQVGKDWYIQLKNWDKWQWIRKEIYKKSMYPKPDGADVIEEIIEEGTPLPPQDDKKEEQKKPRGKHMYQKGEVTDEMCEEISIGYMVELNYVKQKRTDMELYCGSKGVQYANYKMTLMNWIRKDIEDGKAKRIRVAKPVNEYVEQRKELTPEQKDKAKKVLDNMRKELKDKFSMVK